MTDQTNPQSSPPTWHQLIARIAASKAGLWAIVIAIILAVLTGHQTLGVMDRDEARFAQASKQMLESGDLVTPYFMDEIRAKKPIAIYWLQSASAAIFGEDRIASYRLPSLIGLVASLFLVYHFTASLWEGRHARLQGFIAAALLVSSPLILAEAHLAKTDSVLLAVIIFQQFMLWRIYRDRDVELPPRHWFGFWTALAISILLKGPVGPGVAIVTLAGLVIADRKFGWLKYLYWGRGLIWMCALVLPWVVAVSYATDGAFLDIAVKGDFLAKIQSGQESHGAPPATYLVLSALLLWPASLFAGFIGWLGKAVFRQDASRFCLVWAIGYWLMIELVPTKLPHYILPAMPALVMLISHALLSAEATGSKLHRRIADLFYGLGMLAGAVLIAVLVWASIEHSGHAGGRALIFCLVCVCLGGLMAKLVYDWRAERRFGHFVMIIITGLVFNTIAIAGVVSALDNIHVSGRLADRIESISPPPSAVAFAGYHEPSIAFQLGKDILFVTDTEAGLFMAEAQDGLAVIEARHKDSFIAITEQLGLKLRQLDVIDGFNISKGRAIRLILYQPAN
ncbi:MAG: ArnT family glycosyltransferase [Candidatus Puniceispirillaceae bacterium]